MLKITHPKLMGAASKVLALAFLTTSTVWAQSVEAERIDMRVAEAAAEVNVGDDLEGVANRDRIISLVLMLSAPRVLNEEILREAALEGVGLEEDTEAKNDILVVSKPPHYLLNLESGRYVVNNIDAPYFEPGKDEGPEVVDPLVMESIKESKAWISIDWYQKDEPEDLHLTYRDIGKMAAALAGSDTLAVYCPDLDRLAEYNDLTETTLRGDQPLSVFQETAVPRSVSLKGNDPRLKAARAEAKKKWPEFVRAFNDKTGAQFVVKGQIKEGEVSEFLWLNVSSLDEEQVHGTLDNEPAHLSTLKMGEELHIKIADVDDWLFLDESKKPVGGFTAKVLDHMEIGGE